YRKPAFCPGPHSEMKQPVFLIQDGGASHIAGDTQNYFAKSHGWWRPRYTPANASWLNQAEILIHAFKHYYLKRKSWQSQEEFKTHVRHRGRNTIIVTPTHSSGHGRIKKCVNGSQSTSRINCRNCEQRQ